MSHIESIIEVSRGTENFKIGIYLVENEMNEGTFGTFLPVGWIPKTKKGVVSNWKKMGGASGPTYEPHQWWQCLSELRSNEENEKYDMDFYSVPLNGNTDLIKDKENIHYWYLSPR